MQGTVNLPLFIPELACLGEACCGEMEMLLPCPISAEIEHGIGRCTASMTPLLSNWNSSNLLTR